MTYRHTFDDPDRFVTGTLGEPGARVFYLQARQDGRIVSVVVEKEQVRAMADHFDTTLEQVARLDDEVEIPPARDTARDLAPLELPLVEEFRVGTIGIGWDTSSRRFFLELSSVVEVESTNDPVDLLAAVTEPPEPDESLTILLTPEQARDFVPRARYFVQAGRPPCPFCQQPIGPGGHICPRADGYRRLGA
ncbi:MAG TPA: DUF3090 domain-containing protein [Propionibacteriaceae bacterium]|nr:DUF3090 domain-containing protein [Propionibacteriaceae bacterium]HQE32307.1 DUF3090 domain-containing protein [Propionibacteriaceae bacterium]